MNRKRLAAAFVLLLAGAVVFAGAKKEKEAAGLTLLRIGTEGAMPPYNFVNEKGEADGYDVATVKAIVELLPEYSAEFVPIAWEGIFVALEGGEFDLLASFLAWRKEREEKYYLSKIPYMWYSYSIVFKKGRNDIRSIKDLEGKKVAAGLGAAYTVQLEEYIKRTGAKIEIVYTDGNIANALTELDNGRVDATISSVVTTQITADKLGYQIDSLPLTEDGWTVGPIHLLFPKTEEGRSLRDQFDVALEKIIANGKLREISRQYLFGKDYTTKEALEAGA
jgi:L-cystine transport system substrate-binding protein